MKIRRFLSLAVIAALIILTLAACGTQSSDSVTAPALMSKVTKYEMNYQTGEFELKDETEYEYENAYPVMMKYHDLMANLDDKTTFEYSFNDGRPVKMKSYDENGDPDMAVSYTKKGLRNREHYFIPNSTMELIYQYGNRDNYFTLVHHESVVEDPEDPEVPKDHAEEIDSVIVTTKDGLLEKTVNDGIFANWGDDEVKKWTRFMGSYTAEYDSNGIVSLTSGVYSVGESGPEEKFELTMEDGRVKEVVRSRYGKTDEGEESWDEDAKFVFEYTDTEISKDRYASMINNVIMEGGGNYYIFNWY